MTLPRLQRTLANTAAIEGRGYWSGRPVRVEFRPAAAGAGVSFVRDDLASAGADGRVAALIGSRRPAQRRTALASTAGAEVEMTEHVLAALAGLGIDNCEVGVTSCEMPAFDGSAAEFVVALDAAGVEDQPALCHPLVVRRPVKCGGDEVWIEARPPMVDGLTIEYRLDYGHGSAIGRQWLVIDVTEDTFRSDIAPARTFLLQSEAAALLKQGLAGHVTAKDLLVFRDNPQTDADRQPIDNHLRFNDECVRHKVLDVVGDLAMLGRPLVGHIVASCSGHRLNGDLVEALLATHPIETEVTRRRTA
ncbi:MAG: UDP-3-O-acyl-N-acetylglucosamine deacetylase [Lacipirellulaceae bacterium]